MLENLLEEKVMVEKVSHDYLEDVLIPIYLNSVKKLIQETDYGIDFKEVEHLEDYCKGKMVGIYEAIIELTENHHQIRNSLEFV